MIKECCVRNLYKICTLLHQFMASVYRGVDPDPGILIRSESRPIILYDRWIFHLRYIIKWSKTNLTFCNNFVYRFWKNIGLNFQTGSSFLKVWICIRLFQMVGYGNEGRIRIRLISDRLRNSGACILYKGFKVFTRIKSCKYIRRNIREKASS